MVPMLSKVSTEIYHSKNDKLLDEIWSDIWNSSPNIGESLTVQNAPQQSTYQAQLFLGN